MILRTVATTLFGLLIFIIGSFFSANVRKLASERGWDKGLVLLWDRLPAKLRDQLRGERLLGLWWLWFIFGVSGGFALALWLPLISTEPGTNTVQFVKTVPRLQFFGDQRIPKEISSDNVFSWFAYYSPSLRVTGTNAEGKVISGETQPTWAIFITLDTPSAYRQVITVFSNPEVTPQTEVRPSLARSIVITSNAQFPAGVLDIYVEK
jgi:hypothetical protein